MVVRMHDRQIKAIGGWHQPPGGYSQVGECGAEGKREMREDRSKFHPLSLDSAERFVYRYRRAERALKEIEKNTLRMAPFRELNDPKEFADWRFNFSVRNDFDPRHER
jgi:hypothetical protein